MPFDYVVYKETRLVISTRIVTWEGIKSRQDQTKTDPNFDPGFDQIVDLRLVTRFEMSLQQTRSLARRQNFLLNQNARLLQQFRLSSE